MCKTGKGNEFVVKSIQTDKAKINILSNNKVEKQFSKESQAKKEYNSLLHLHKLFRQKDHNNWTYKTIKPLSLSNSKIVMEIAEGVTFEETLKRKPFSSYLTGIWLGLFHNYCRTFGDKEIRNIDYNIKNILIDNKSRTFTVIDPGAQFNKEYTVEKAIINYILGLVIGAIKQRTLPKFLIKSFLEGYFSVSKEVFNLSSFKKELNEVIKTRYRIQKRKNKNQPLSFVLLQILRVYIILVLPNMLKEYDQTDEIE